MERRLLALLGVSALVAGAIACGSSKPATPVAPTSTGSTSAADGSTLKVTPASLQSPLNDQKLTTPVVILTAGPSSGVFASGLALQYRFEVRNASNSVVQEALVGTTSWQVTATLLPATRYTWRVRPEYQGEAGPWSGTGSFVTLDPFIIDDPLTDGRTVGSQVGGRFIPGQGWQSSSLTAGIDYDLATPCSDCRLEFDVTNFGTREGFSFQKDLKWISMGEAGAFGDFSAFRNHPWKMHLEQRSDGDGTGMKITWRNNGFGEGEPGDHVLKVDPAVPWNSSQVYHFVLDWSPRGFSVEIDGEEWFADGFGGNPYAPANHRISLGCYPRAESFVGIIYRNVKLKKH